MMTRTTLLALASRVEAATAPDRGIEREIAIAVGWHFYDRKVDHTRPAIEQWWRPGATTPSTDFPRFMASLDDAMSLYITIPERIPSNPRLATAEALRKS